MTSGARRESGQAAVEAALTLPLMLFMILGTLQLFMMLQGRVMAEHAAYKAARTGSVQFGNCQAMTHAAIAALLPSFHSYLGPTVPGGTPGAKLAWAWRKRTAGMPYDNQYDPAVDGGHDGAVVWIYRPSPRRATVTVRSDDDFDNPFAPGQASGGGYRLDLRLVYWFPLKVPFANWVMARMYAAYWGLENYNAVNPLIPTQTAAWGSNGAERATNAMAGAVSGEFQARLAKRQYVFPITATYSMHMMSPPRPRFWQRQHCEPVP